MTLSNIINNGTVSLTANVNSTTPLTGTVEFYDGSTKIGQTPISSNMNISSVISSIGNHQLQAKYLGDATHLSSDSSQLNVNVSESNLPDFTYDSDTILWINTVNAKLTTASLTLLTKREKYHYDRMIKRMKFDETWSYQLSLQLRAAPSQGNSSRQKIISSVDIRNPSINSTEIGTINETPDTGSISGNTSSYINTGFDSSLLNQDDNFIMMMTNKLETETYSGTALDLCGVISGGIGLTINPYVSGTGGISIRNNNASLTPGSASSVSNGSGFVVINRDSSTSVTCYRNGKKHLNLNLSSAGKVSGNIFLGAVNNGGTPTTASTGFRYSAFGAGRSMPANLQKKYYASVRTLVDAIQWGLVDFNEPGTNPTNVVADAVVYGLTSNGIAAAYELKRQGKNVILVGGWRDFPGNLGGMMAGGLGFSDFDNPSGIAGLSKLILALIRSKQNINTDYFNCRFANYTFKQLLDPNKPCGLDIPVYLSEGIESTTNDGGTVTTSIKTVDGRRFYAKYFIDSSYESDLIALSNISYKVGREASSTGEEIMNGWRGTSTSFNEGSHQFNVNGTLVNVDPYKTIGDSTSGLIYGVRPWPTGRTTGQGDVAIYKNRLVTSSSLTTPVTQSFNFRLMMATSAVFVSDETWASTPPPNYQSSEFESLYRFCEAATAASLSYGYVGTILKADSVGTGALDINSQGGLSTDFWFGAWDYVEASYAAREIIWNETKQRTYRLFYAHRNEPRIPSALRTSANTFSFHNENFVDVYKNDDIHMSTQLYIREARRIIGDLIIDANDMVKTDGTTPKSIKTIGLASYAEDSHHTGQYVHPTISKIWNEGGFLRFGPGGADQLTPIPYEAICPKRTESTNVFSIFGCSATHAAFGSIRMEFTACMLGQAAGMAIAIALESGNIAIQDVLYNTNSNDNLNLRSRLLASATNTAYGETTPILPMVN